MDGTILRAALQGAQVGRPSEPTAAEVPLPPEVSRAWAKLRGPTISFPNQFWGEGAGQ